MEQSKKEKWVDAKQAPPLKLGWYMVKLNNDGDECEAPYVIDMKGKMSWLLPDPSVVTHWMKRENYKNKYE